MTEWIKKKEAKAQIQDGCYLLTAPIAIPDQPNVNGNVYTKEVIEKMKEDLKKMILEKNNVVFLVGEPMGLYPRLDMVVGTVEKIEDADITIKLLDTPKSQIVKQIVKSKLPKSGFYFGVNGLGEVDENGVIHDFTLRDITLIGVDDE
jgi:hypothetical protein